MYSLKDSKGKLMVDCTECVRGHNGEKSCACGWYRKKPGMGCFSGTLLPGVEKPPERCDWCGKFGELYKIEDDEHICSECLTKLSRQIEDERVENPENYCISCGDYSDILEHGYCPICFEGRGYTR